MRIVHITWEYPPLIYGGIAPHVAHLAQAQAALGHEVSVITQGDPGATVEAGVRVIRRAASPPHLEFAEATLLAWVAGLNNSLSAALVSLRQAPDVVHVHDWVTSYTAAIALAQGYPVVATMHSTEAGRHQGWIPTPLAASVHELEAWLAGMASQIITCSTQMAWEVDRQFPAAGQITVVPNGVSAADWRTVRRPQGTPTLVYAGRLEWEKGLFDLVDALPTLRRRFPGLKLVVAGRGGQQEALVAHLKKRRASPAVHWAGQVSQPELRELFGSADAVVVPSRYEPFGIVALEAAATGAPLVLADIGGLAEIADGGRSALTFPPGDVTGLTAAISTVLTDPQAAAARARHAAASLQTRFAWPAIAAQTVDIYRQAHLRPQPQQISTAELIGTNILYPNAT